MTWHIEATELDAYASATLDEVGSASVEAHLIVCDHCRTQLNLLAVPRTQHRLDETWANIVEAMDAPATGVVERALAGMGVADHTARLLAATPALHVSWLAAVTVALVFAVAAAHASPRGFLVFLALAPLVPLAGIATAYGPGVDPTYEIGMASPLHSFRLLLIRAAAVLATSVGLAGIAAIALPSLGWPVVAWLLPALALSLASLALGGILNPLWASAGLGLGWLTAVLAVGAGSTSPRLLLGATAQITWAVLAAVAAGVVFLRRERYDVSAAQDN